MAEELVISKSVNKKERYQTLLPQIKALVEGEPDQVANLSNIAAALKQTMDFFWVGFYLVKENQLVLGLFKGQLPAPELILGRVSVARPGRKSGRLLCLMLKNFQDTSLVIPLQNLK